MYDFFVFVGVFYGLVCTCIHESDAELICIFLRRFNILCYALGFYKLYCSYVKCL